MIKNYTSLTLALVLLLSSAVATVAQSGSRLPGGSLRTAVDMRASSSSSLRGGSNDECANASSLSVNAPGTCAANAVAGDNGLATQDGGEPECDATDTEFQDVWYTFNSGPNTAVMIDFTQGTIADIVLEVYSGGCSGTTVYCDFGLTHMVPVSANTDYTVRVASNNDFGVGGTFTICVTSVEEGPANDLCANATPITVGATCIGTAGTLENATQSLAGALCSGFTATVANDVWYTFTATAASTTVQVTGDGDGTTGVDAILEVFSGTCAALTSLGCVDATTRGGTENLVVTTAVGTTYYYRIYQWPYTTPQTVFGFNTCVFSAGGSVAPVNDLCANATSITVGATCVGTTGTVENATQSVAGALCSGFTATVANDVWYTFTATAASTTVEVTGAGDATTGVDPILEVFSGNCAALVSLGCVDATTRGGTETLVVPTTAGNTYYYRIYHWPYTGPQTEFGFTTCVFSLGGSVAPVNDLCANATNIAVGATCVGTAGTVENATQSAPGAVCSGFTATVANDVWYSFTATSTSTTVQVIGDGDATTGVDPILQVFSGDCATLTSLGCVDATTRGGAETLIVTTAVGTTYYYRIYHWPYTGPQTVFGFTTCVFGTPPPPPNDLCTGAVPQDLEVGSTLTYTGDNTGATVLDEDVEYLVVWEAFTLSTCATVTVNYCVPGSVFEDFLVNLATQCPNVLTGLQTGTVANNCTVTFTELQAGTYYIPVLVDPALTPVGAYTISVSAVACPPGYCSASATNVDEDLEKISNVAFADINNPSTLPDGYEDFTSVVGNVTQDSNQDITVTISNGYDDDQVLVWIDFDQSESFEPGELVYTSPLGVGPHTGSIAVPLNASLGQTRMRVRLHDSVLGGNTAPCGTSTYGQVEDYTINIDISTGLSDAAALEFGVYPNPSNGDLFVRHNIDGPAVLDVLDIAGHVVYSAQRSLVSGEVAQLPLAGKLAAGTYILRVTGDNIRGEQRVVVY